MTNQTHAIVVGGSLAGLFAARILADHFDQVTVLDRDQLPPEPDHRAGVPQAHHVHGLLARGRQQIERFFPGLMAELRTYVNALLAAGRTDREVSRAYLRMLNMLDRPRALLRPGVAVRVAGQALLRRLGVAADAPATALPPALLAELGVQ